MKCEKCSTENGAGAKFCGKCGQPLEEKSSKNGKIKGVFASIISVIIFLLAIGIGRYLTEGLFSSSAQNIKISEEINTKNDNSLNDGIFIDQTSKTSLISSTVEGVKSQLKIPSQLDDVTTITDVTAQPNAIRYHYVLSNIDSDKISKDFLKNYLSTSICENNDTKNLLNMDINMEYSYTVKETNQNYFFTFNKADCQ